MGQAVIRLHTLKVFVTLIQVNMANKAQPPELKKYMDHQMTLKLNGNRTVSGILRGFDPFMNLVMDEAVEHCKTGEKNNIGMVVVRGNSVTLLETNDRLG